MENLGNDVLYINDEKSQVIARVCDRGDKVFYKYIKKSIG
jgi:hypothetical protein